MSDLVEDFLSRERDGFGDIESIPSVFGGESDTFGDPENGQNDEPNEVIEDFFYKGQPPSAEVPEKIRKWKEDQENRLKEKDSAEEIAKEVLRKQAEKELEDWSKKQNQNIVKTKILNRNAEKENIASEPEENGSEPGTEWEKIAKLCDFTQSAKARFTQSIKDNSRMKSIILQLKQTPIEKP